MPKKLHERGPVYPKQNIEKALERTDPEDLAAFSGGYTGSRARVQSRLGDNNARKFMQKVDAPLETSYPKPSGKKVPKD